MSYERERPMCAVCRREFENPDPDSGLLYDDYDGYIGACPQCRGKTGDLDLLDDLICYEEVLYWLHCYHSRQAELWRNIGHESRAEWEESIARMCRRVVKDRVVEIPGGDK